MVEFATTWVTATFENKRIIQHIVFSNGILCNKGKGKFELKKPIVYLA
jgi:hypothetical protein